MKINYYFLFLAIFSNSLNFVCKAADASSENHKAISVLTVSEFKVKAEELFKLRASVAQKDLCDKELLKLLDSIQIRSMTLYSSIKNRLDSLQAEERYLKENSMKSFSLQL